MPFFLIGTAAAVAVPAAPEAGATATQTQIAATESQLARIETTIANEQQQSAALDEQYLAAQEKVQQVQSALETMKAQLSATKARVRDAKVRLNHDAIDAYVFDQPANNIDSLFTASPTTNMARRQYENIVAGNINLAVDALAFQQAQLTAATRVEQAQEQADSAAVNQVHSLQAANQRAAAAAAATLGQVQGTLAAQVAQYAEQQAQAQAAYAIAHPNNASSAARNATQAASVAVALEGPAAAGAVTAANNAAAASGAQPVAGTSTATGSGAQAVAAAESQLGVPYVWGGESPGNGFDCSGLTQWSWAQAGVSIPRVAVDQAGAITHVPLTALEPGDLLFYYNLDGDSTIDHVVMYVGSGPYGSQTIIEAPYTGSNVKYAPLFTEGLVAAGRP